MYEDKSNTYFFSLIFVYCKYYISIELMLKEYRYLTLLVFLDKGFKFQPNVYNGCQDLLMMPMNLSDIGILNIKSSNYCCIISEIS